MRGFFEGFVRASLVGFFGGGGVWVFGLVFWVLGFFLSLAQI